MSQKVLPKRMIPSDDSWKASRKTRTYVALVGNQIPKPQNQNKRNAPSNSWRDILPYILSLLCRDQVWSNVLPKDLYITQANLPRMKMAQASRRTGVLWSRNGFQVARITDYPLEATSSATLAPKLNEVDKKVLKP